MPVAIESISPSAGDATDSFLVRRGAGPLGHTIELLSSTSVKALLSIASGDVSGLSEAIDDRVAALVVAGTNMTITYDDVLNTLTFDAAGGGGSPGGSNGEVQYNNAGAFAGAADVEIEGGQLRLPAIATPTAPAAGGVKLFGKDYANAPAPHFRGPLDAVALPLQPGIAEGNFMQWTPATGTGVSVWGWPAATVAGTATAATTVDGSRRSRMKRIEYLVAVASTTAVASWRIASAQVTINGGNSWEGGFRGVMHSGPSTGVAANSSHRYFMGLIENLAPTDAEPSSRIRTVGIGYDAADTQVQFMHNDASGVATKIALGASFPKPNADRSFTYRLRLYAPPGTTRALHYEVTYLETGAVATGIVTTNLPATSDFLVPLVYTSVGGVSAVTGFAIGAATFHTEPY